MRLPSAFSAAAALLVLTACGSPAKSYYVLAPEGPAPDQGGGAGIGVGPVALASYLDRPNIVFHESANRLAVAESHRWAGDLEENVASVLATNLGRVRGSGDVRTYPWDHDRGLRYQVAVDIRQLHGTSEGDAVLEATWRVYALPDRGMVTTRSWSGSEPLAQDGYDALVAAQSRLLAKLAREISASLR